MENVFTKKAIRLSKEAAFLLLTVVCAVLLPQIFHAVGILVGVGGKLGQIFLPMYIPVLIIGFYRGPATGALSGLLSPLVSFAITEMPSAALLPYITVELVAMGALAGLFAKSKLPAVPRVLSVQVIAKLIRIAVLATVLFVSSGTLTASALFAGLLISLPGVVLQLALVSFLLIRKEKQHE